MLKERGVHGFMRPFRSRITPRTITIKCYGLLRERKKEHIYIVSYTRAGIMLMKHEQEHVFVKASMTSLVENNEAES